MIRRSQVLSCAAALTALAIATAAAGDDRETRSPDETIPTKIAFDLDGPTGEEGHREEQRDRILALLRALPAVSDAVEGDGASSIELTIAPGAKLGWTEIGEAIEASGEELTLTWSSIAVRGLVVLDLDGIEGQAQTELAAKGLLEHEGVERAIAEKSTRVRVLLDAPEGVLLEGLERRAAGSVPGAEIADFVLVGPPRGKKKADAPERAPSPPASPDGE